MLPLSVIAFLSSTLDTAGHRWPISVGSTTVRDIEGDARYRYRYRFVSQSSSITALRRRFEVARATSAHGVKTQEWASEPDMGPLVSQPRSSVPTLAASRERRRFAL